MISLDKNSKVNKTYSVYNKPGRASAPIHYNEPFKEKAFFVSDCIYFESVEDNEDSFGVTLWGMGSKEETYSRDFLTVDNYNGEGISLTTLLAHCMNYSALIKTYMEES